MSDKTDTTMKERAETLFRKLGYAPNSGFGEKAIPLIVAALHESYHEGYQAAVDMEADIAARGR